MSYNLLADQVCDAKRFGTSEQICDFNFRGPRIIEEISQSDASLICLQEIDRIDDFYDPKLKELGFNVVYGKRGYKELVDWQ